MTRIRTLTTAMAILAFGAMTAGCAGNIRYSFGPNQPMMQAAVPAEELDDVADVPWDRCDGECRYREAARICSTTVQVVGAQRQRAHSHFMQFSDRTAFRARVMQSCVGGGQRFAYHEPTMRGLRNDEPWLHRKPARVIKRPVGVTASHFRCNVRTGLPETPGNAWCGDLRR